MEGNHTDVLSSVERWLCAVLSISLLVVVTDVLIEGPLVALDVAVNNAFVAEPTHLVTLDRIGQRVATIPPLLLVAGLLGRRLRSWRPVVVVLGAIVGLNVVVGAFKLSLDRGHPRDGDPSLFLDATMFPSGHAANVVLSYGLIAYLVLCYAPRRPSRRVATGAVAALTVTMVSVSLYRGMHWVTDLLAGALIGGLLLLASIALDRRLAAIRTVRVDLSEHRRLPVQVSASEPEPEPVRVREDVLVGRSEGRAQPSRHQRLTA